VTGRTVPTWQGSTPDAAIPARVKLRIWERAGGKCEITGRKLYPGDAHDFDHIVPLAMGGEHSESNLRLVSRDAHREKTKADVTAIAKAKRVALKHTGLWPKSKRPIQSRGFERTR
jgi:5-methylcytosine-specific restriction protein A